MDRRHGQLVADHAHDVRPAAAAEHDAEAEVGPAGVAEAREVQEEGCGDGALGEAEDAGDVVGVEAAVGEAVFDGGGDGGGFVEGLRGGGRSGGRGGGGEPLVVGARVGEEGENAGTGGAGDGRVDEDECEVRG